MPRQRREHRRGRNGKSTSKKRPITRSQTKQRQVKCKTPNQRSDKRGGKNSKESKAVATGNVNGELVDRITLHREDIERYTNFSELSSYLIQEGVLNHEQNEHILSEASNRDKTSRIIQWLTAMPNGFSKFLACIKGETSHMGHAYIATLLEGRQYAQESELKVSAACKERISNNLVRFSKGVSLSYLVPHLKQTFYLPSIRERTQLLTDDEAEILLLGCEETQDRVMKLFLILGTKGPLAHSQFVRCMHAEDQHITHGELFRAFFGDLDLSFSPVLSSEEDEDGIVSSSQAQKRKNEEYLATDYDESDDELVPLTPAKKECGTPIETWLETDGVLEGDGYAKLMDKFYILHHNKDGHLKLQNEAEEAIAQMDLPIELRALYRIELARGFIFRTQLQNDRAVELLTAALDMCIDMPGNNAYFIIGRCHHTLADLYRCANDYSRAKEHSMKALQVLQCVKPGLDTAIAHYVNACILLECNPRPFAVGADFQTIELSFHRAIGHGQGNHIARQSIVPQSHCRLAQMYLGSTQYKAGVTDNIENLRKARESLDTCESDFAFLSQQSKHLYYVIESDWYRNSGEVTKAVESCRTACRIAEGTVCIGSPSAEARLSSLSSFIVA